MYNQSVFPLKPQTPVLDSYIACGCGCCGGVEPEIQCLSSDDDLQRIIKADIKASKDPGCVAAGCSIGVKYQYCK